MQRASEFFSVRSSSRATTVRRCWLIDASIRNASSGRLRSSVTNSVFGIRITALDVSARALAG